MRSTSVSIYWVIYIFCTFMIWWCICIFPCICTCHKTYMHIRIYFYIYTYTYYSMQGHKVSGLKFLECSPWKLENVNSLTCIFRPGWKKKQSRRFDLNLKGVEGYHIEVPWGSCLLNWIWLRRMCCFNTLWTVSLFDEVSASIRWWNILKSVSIWHTSQNTTGLLCARLWSRDLWGDFAL